MTYERFFAFGCSFTQYWWPTWADIIAYDLQIPSENWGVCGLGNVGIFHRMVEADITHNFTNNDLIITAWSTWCREDRVNSIGGWHARGNILNWEEYRTGKLGPDFWNKENDVIKNATAIISANRLFNINYQLTIFEGKEVFYDNTRSLPTYAPLLPQLLIFPRLPDNEYWGGTNVADNHPDILEHLSFVINYVYPIIGSTIRSETVKYYTDLYNQLLNEIKVALPTHDYHKTIEFFRKRFGDPKRPGL